MEPSLPHLNGSLVGLYDVRQLRIAVETINNLVFLAERQAEDPECVRSYLKLIGEQIASINKTIKKRPT